MAVAPSPDPAAPASGRESALMAARGQTSFGFFSKKHCLPCLPGGIPPDHACGVLARLVPRRLVCGLAIKIAVFFAFSKKARTASLKSMLRRSISSSTRRGHPKLMALSRMPAASPPGRLSRNACMTGMRARAHLFVATPVRTSEIVLAPATPPRCGAWHGRVARPGRARLPSARLLSARLPSAHLPCAARHAGNGLAE